MKISGRNPACNCKQFPTPLMFWNATMSMTDVALRIISFARVETLKMERKRVMNAMKWLSLTRKLPVPRRRLKLIAFPCYLDRLEIYIFNFCLWFLINAWYLACPAKFIPDELSPLEPDQWQYDINFDNGLIGIYILVFDCYCIVNYRCIVFCLHHRLPCLTLGVW